MRGIGGAAARRLLLVLALVPVENPLRRRDDPELPRGSEEDILEALTALAGGR